MDNFVEGGIWVAKFCLCDRFVDVSRGALREGLIYCGEEDILGKGPDPLDVDTWGEKLIEFDLSRRG